MKKIFITLLSGFLTLAATAQTITLTFNGTNANRNYHVVLDGVSYYSNSSTTGAGTSVKKEITIANQSLGAHTIAVYRQRNTGTYKNGTTTPTTGTALYTNTFQLRQDYDMNISINGSGQVRFTEKRIRTNRPNRGNQALTPMTDQTFNQLLQTVRNRSTQTTKATAVRDAFVNTANYFTTAQVRQLLLLVNTEANRLALAKLGYPRVVDPENFTQLYNVFARTASRNELDVFIRNNPNTNGSYTGGGNNTNIKTQMADYQFNQLLQTANSQYNQSTRFNTIRTAINTATNYFSTAQLRQLLSLVDVETNRLLLAKNAYLKVTDPTNFTTLYDLFFLNSSRTELNSYVVANGGTGASISVSNTAMADYQFSQLLQNANAQYNQTTRFNTINNALNTNGNYFTTAQIRQLLTTVEVESNRLVLAKNAYMKVTDPSNYTTLYDLFTSATNRTELNNFVVQNGGTGSSQTYSNRVPLTDDAFNRVLQEASNHILPWNKTADVRTAFNNTSYFFTTAQIRQLLTIISGENDRLALAKLAWARVSDPANFTQLYDLFTTQAYKDDLNAYIVARPF